MGSLYLPHPEYIRDICSAIHDRDHAAFLSVLVGRPDLDIYCRVYKNSGFKA